MIDSPRSVDCDFAIVGAGALGSILGAHLHRAGHRVALLARGARATWILSEGLHITGLAEITESVPVIDDPSLLRNARFLVLATKALGTRQALDALKGAKIGAAFSVQNGVLKDELLAEAFGKEAVVGAVADFSGELEQTGRVRFTRNEAVFLGELDGRSSGRALEMATSLNEAGINAVLVDDIRSLEWSKFAAWIGCVAMAVIARGETRRVLSDAGAARIIVGIVKEMGKLALSEAVKLGDEVILPVRTICQCTDEEAIGLIRQVGEVYAAKAPGHKMSALQDVEAGRPLELEETFGHAIRLAEKNGIDAPLLRTIYPLIAVVDRMPSYA